MRKKLLFLALAILLLPSMVFAKDISLKEFGYSDGDYEYFEGVTETSDGGYVAVGESDWYPVIVKYDKNDKIEWRVFDKTYSYFYDIDVDSAGNFYVVGYTWGDATVEYDDPIGFVSKYDKDGKLIKKVLIGEGKPYTELYDLEVDDDRIVAVGYQCFYYLQSNDMDMISGSYSDGCGAYSVVLDKELEFKSEQIFDYGYEDYYLGVSLTSDGGYIAVGASESQNIPDVDNGYMDSVQIAIKFDKDNEKEWIYVLPFDTELNYENTCSYDYKSSYYDVVETCDGNYAIVGSMAKLTMMEKENVESSTWRNMDEILGEQYNGLEVDYDSDQYMFYESTAAIVTILDKDGKKVSEYIENGEYDDVYTDVLLLDNCSLMVTGFTGHEAASSNVPQSLRGNEESLGWNSYTCIYDNSDAAIRIFDKDLKVEWSKDYHGSKNETLINVSPVGDNEFVAVGWLNSNDLPEVKLSENADGLVVRLKVTYEITKNPTKGGTFDAANENGKADVVAAGDTGVITTTPDEGYKVQSVKVVDSEGKEVPVTEVENGKYTYPIYDDTWVTVTFVEKEIVEAPKTGVEDFLLLGVAVVTLCSGAYYVASKNNVFKKM